MFGPSVSLVDSLLFRHALAAWGRAAERAEDLDLAGLRPLRARAAALRLRLDRVIHAADRRLARPPAGTGGARRPLGCDWDWRPAMFCGPLDPPGVAAPVSGTAFTAEARVFHDCPHAELGLRRITGPAAPHGLCIEVFRFAGSFLSLAIDLPQAAADGLGRRHLIRLDSVIETERPLPIFARLNICHGPDFAQLVRAIPPDGPATVVEFDLALTGIDARGVGRMWLDLIFEAPQMNRITLGDMVLSRRPRAEP
ncbi:DUF6478 family protein [Rhodovulum sp.]|uniref:DUF6478 family protein n=1 Tax=Rhodovulum sp. TaxID=34009 RepID=UPI001793CEA6|nr:DUF6478 family protein [Rhodovulum sp.]HDR27974.1 hypothetical protein [Rhodovulum sp.]